MRYADLDDEVRNYRHNKRNILWLLLGLLLLLFLCQLVWGVVRGSMGAEDGNVATEGVNDVVGDGAVADAGKIDNIVDPPTLLRSPSIEDGRLILVGQAAPNSKVRVLLNGNEIGLVDSDADGQWVVNAPAPAPGDYEMKMSVLGVEGMPEATMNVPSFRIEEPTVAEAEEPVAEAVAEPTPEPTAEPVVEEPAPEETTEEVAEEPVTEEAPVVSEEATSGEANEGTDGSAQSGFVVPADWAPISYSLPPYFDKYIGGGLRVDGNAQPNTAVEISINGQPHQTVAVDANGNWAMFTQLSPTQPGTYTVAMRYPGSDQTDPAFDVTVPSDTQFASKFNCPNGVPPFGSDLGDTYVVADCEYFSLIAERAGISYQTLLNANPQLYNLDYLQAGDVLNLPPRP